MPGLGAGEILILVVLAVVLLGGGVGVGVIFAASSLRRRQNEVNRAATDPALTGVAPPPPPVPGPSASLRTVIAPPDHLDTVRVHDDMRIRIGSALAQGRKIEAIKLYREATGAGLKDAKDAVEYWESHGAVEVRED